MPFISCIRYGTCGCASQNITSEVLQAENESKSEQSDPRGDFRVGRGGLDPGPGIKGGLDQGVNML